MANPIPQGVNIGAPLRYETEVPSCLDTLINSLAFKILCCTPLVGAIPAAFSFIYLWQQSRLPLDAATRLQNKKNERDYSAASTIRHVAELALVALGILSVNPVLSGIFAVWWACDWIKADLDIQDLEARQRANV